MPSTLAVLITYFNEKELLTQCLKSLSIQDPLPDEIIIYDDASQYPAKNYVISTLPLEIIRSEKNYGPVYGRNLLLKRAKSTYIHFHDADDLFLKNWSKYIYKELKKNPDLIINEIISIDNKKILTRELLDLKELIEKQDLIKFCLDRCLLIDSTVIKKDIAINIGGFNENLKQSEDYDFFLRIAVSQPRYSVIPTPLTIYRNRKESRSHQYKKEIWTSMFLSLNSISEKLKFFYKPYLGKAYYNCAFQLFRLHAFREAHRAFRLAKRFGCLKVMNQKSIYNILSRFLPFEIVEVIGYIYRKILPQRIRCLLNAI
ncbi:MAG: glycosyltransferase family 2 protein [Candidatus Omnitrophica bacterium]|nr:glycosyltransferase family 2 protein [Candidatus Omnitrophota bacterium]